MEKSINLFLGLWHQGIGQGNIVPNFVLCKKSFDGKLKAKVSLPNTCLGIHKAVLRSASARKQSATLKSNSAAGKEK